MTGRGFLFEPESLPLSMPAVVNKISGSKMNPLPVIIFLVKIVEAHFL